MPLVFYITCVSVRHIPSPSFSRVHIPHGVFARVWHLVCGRRPDVSPYIAAGKVSRCWVVSVLICFLFVIVTEEMFFL